MWAARAFDRCRQWELTDGELGYAEINALVAATDYWGFVETPVGRMFLGGNDDGVALRYLRGHEYEPASLARWRASCAGAECVIDVGAHTGVYTLAAYRAGARRVVSVEPYWLNAARLVLNLRANKHPVDSVVVAAAAGQAGTAELAVRARADRWYCGASPRVASPPAGWVAYPVRAVRLDDLVPPSVWVAAVKLDVEDSARAALAGMPRLLREHRPDLILEVSEPGLAEWLRPIGYRFHRIDEATGCSPVTTLAPTRDADGGLSPSCRNAYATVREGPP